MKGLQSTAKINNFLTELKHDDGTCEGNSFPWTDEIGSEIAVRFTPDSYPSVLQKAKFYVTSAGIPSTTFSIKVYDDDNGSYPGTIINKTDIEESAVSGAEWVEVDLSSLNLTISEGDFFVAMCWSTAPGIDGENAQFLGVDFSEPYANNSYFKHGATGNWYLRVDRNMMIRTLAKDRG